jgi:pyruvate dehydrogenase E2 component (dihydrolipoamide acetyltransferase)
MSRSKREIPHYYLTHTIDLHELLAWLAEENARRPIEARLVPAVALLRAVAVTLRDFPELNGFYVNGEHARSADIHVGVAISLRGGGLVAPAIHDTPRLSLDELMAAFRDLVSRARAGKRRIRKDRRAPVGGRRRPPRPVGRHRHAFG